LQQGPSELLSSLPEARQNPHLFPAFRSFFSGFSKSSGACLQKSYFLRPRFIGLEPLLVPFWCEDFFSVGIKAAIAGSKSNTYNFSAASGTSLQILITAESSTSPLNEFVFCNVLVAPRWCSSRF